MDDFPVPQQIRSVVVKGIEALLLESLTAAEKAGVRERIVDSISQTFPGLDWRETATRLTESDSGQP